MKLTMIKSSILAKQSIKSAVFAPDAIDAIECGEWEGDTIKS